VAGFQEFRLWLDAHADAGRRAGDDHIAGLQYEELRGVPDQMGHAEDHGLGRALLPRLVVDCEPHVEPLRVADLILGDEPRPQRAEALAALALAPLSAAALDLKTALGDIVGEAIAGDGLHRLVLGEIACAAADHDAELDLVIELGRALRDHRVIVRPADRARRLVEDDRLLRDRHAGFSGVIGIVEADGDEIADAADAWPEPRRAANERQLLWFELAQ